MTVSGATRAVSRIWTFSAAAAMILPALVWEETVRLSVVLVTILGLLAGCMSMPQPPKQSLFVLFFVPGTVRLAPEAEQIVHQVAVIAASSKTSRIEVSVPTDAPGGMTLREGRFTSIQNALAASQINPMLFTRAPLTDAAARLAGGADRAELRLVP